MTNRLICALNVRQNGLVLKNSACKFTCHIDHHFKRTLPDERISQGRGQGLPQAIAFDETGLAGSVAKQFRSK